MSKIIDNGSIPIGQDSTHALHVVQAQISSLEMSPFRLTPSCMKLAWETHSGSEERDIYFEPKNKSRRNNFLPLYQTRNCNKSRFCFIVPSSMLYFSSIQIKVVLHVFFTNVLVANDNSIFS